MKKYIETEATDECTCGHMIGKSHKSSFRWSKKRNQMDVRLKCRYCKCNLLLKQYEGKL